MDGQTDTQTEQTNLETLAVTHVGLSQGYCPVSSSFPTSRHCVCVCVRVSLCELKTPSGSVSLRIRLSADK